MKKYISSFNPEQVPEVLEVGKTNAMFVKWQRMVNRIIVQILRMIHFIWK